MKDLCEDIQEWILLLCDFFFISFFNKRVKESCCWTYTYAISCRQKTVEIISCFSGLKMFILLNSVSCFLCLVEILIVSRFCFKWLRPRSGSKPMPLIIGSLREQNRVLISWHFSRFQPLDRVLRYLVDISIWIRSATSFLNIYRPIDLP